MTNLKRFGIGAAAIFVVVLLAAAFLVGSQKTITEKTIASRNTLKFTVYCLKGKTILNILVDRPGATNGSFIYELDATGKPIACQ